MEKVVQNIDSIDLASELRSIELKVLGLQSIYPCPEIDDIVEHVSRIANEGISPKSVVLAEMQLIIAKIQNLPS